MPTFSMHLQYALIAAVIISICFRNFLLHPKQHDESQEKATDESQEKATDESQEKATDESQEKATDESQEKATPSKILTWRLLIRPRDNKKPCGLTVKALKSALETRFDVSVTDSDLSLQPQLEGYCAVLTLRAPKPIFEDGKDFELQLGPIENDQIYLEWVPIQTNCISHSNPDLSSVTPDKEFEGITTLYDKPDGENAVE